MDDEHVHDRLAAAALAIGGSEIAQERCRRVRLARRLRSVGAARRDGAADHGDVWRDHLQRVVGSSQQRLVGRSGEIAPALVELRHPEPVQIRLVADDKVAHVRQRLGQRCRVLGKLFPVEQAQRGLPATAGADGDHESNRVELSRKGARLERSELVRRGRGFAPCPVRAHLDLGQAAEDGEVHARLGDHRIRDQARGLRRTDGERTRGGRRGGRCG